MKPHLRRSTAGEKNYNLRPPSSATQPEKKATRDFPNISECHACGIRNTDAAGAGKQKLQTLRSEWRIVLLCSNCFSLVDSGQICSYCFDKPQSSLSQIGEFRCCKCKRMIHESCVLNYSNVPPWSYACSGSGRFFVCVDCWVPKCSVRGRSLGRRGSRKKKFLDSRDFEVEDAVEEANCMMLKKVEGVRRARELDVVARRAVELASDALDSVMEKDNGGCVRMEGDKVDDDFEVVFRLHQVMNGAPRIPLKNSCLLNSRGFGDQEAYKCNGESVAKALGERNVEGDSLLDVDCVKSGRNGEQRVSRETSKHRHTEVVPKEGEGSYSSTLMNSNGHHEINRFSGSQPIRDKNQSMTPEDGGCRRKPDCSMMIKYCRRKFNARNVLDSWHNSLLNSINGDYSSMNSEYQPLKDRDDLMPVKDESCHRKSDHFMRKYSRRKLNDISVLDGRPKSLYACLNHETRALAPGLQLNCSKHEISVDCESQPIRDRNKSMASEDGKCHRNPDRSVMIKYSRKKFITRNVLDGGHNGLMNSISGDDIGMNSECQSLKDKDESMSVEDEGCHRKSECFIRKYSRRKLNDSSVLDSGPNSLFAC